MPLPQASHPPAKSAPASRSATPAPEDEDSDDENDSVEKRMIRLSFRKGGDKPFYTVLRRSLLGRAWEVSGPTVRMNFCSGFNQVSCAE